MRITQVEVTGLFGIFNHCVPFQQNPPLTVIHSPNGFGKTTLLKMIHGGISGQFDVFRRTPFNSFRIELANRTALTIRPSSPTSTKKSKRGRHRPALTFVLEREGKHPVTLPESEAREPGEPPLPLLLSQLDSDFVPATYRLQGDHWIHGATGTAHSLQEIISIFPELSKHPYAQAALRMVQKEPDEVREFRNQLSSSFIQTQRLQSPADCRPSRYDPSPPPPDLELSVTKYAKELSQLIQAALANYGKHSQQLDRTFPARLVEHLRKASSSSGDRNPDCLDELGQDIPARLRELDTKRDNLTRIGLLDAEPSDLRDLSKDDVMRAHDVLTIYVQDVANKLSSFDDLERRITLFLSIINDRFQYKTLDANREQGFLVTSRAPGITSKRTIGLPDLSSGEQHELVVVFELLFKVPRGALLLIDEPEISLHVAWQSKFLEDLLGILEVNDAFALVATHSPTIIGDRWDLTHQLVGPGPMNGAC